MLICVVSILSNWEVHLKSLVDLFSKFLFPIIKIFNSLVFKRIRLKENQK